MKGHVVALLQIIFLLHQSMLSIDAIGAFGPSRVRDEEDGSSSGRQPPKPRTRSAERATVDKYLAWSPLLARA